MSNGQRMQVAKKTFVEADDKTRNGLLYDMIDELFEQTQLQAQQCSQRLEHCQQQFAPKRQEWKSNAYSFLGGIVGAALFFGTFISITTSVGG